jgi:hypothetical protein
MTYIIKCELYMLGGIPALANLIKVNNLKVV